MTAELHGFPAAEPAGRAIAEALGIRFGLVRAHRFPDGELLMTVPEPPETVIAHLSLNEPNDKLIELVLAAEAWRRLGCKRLVLVAPYLAYMRQDLAFAPGQAVSQRAIARLLAGLFDRVVTVDAHLHRTHDLRRLFGKTPAEDLSAGEAIADWAHTRFSGSDPVFVGPDEESEPLVRAVAERTGASWAVLEKHRSGDAQVELVIRDPERLIGRAIVLVDDICSSGSTLMAAVRRAMALGAREVRAVVVHALYDARVAMLLKAAGLVEVISTDSVPHPTNAVGLAPLIARALRDEVEP